MAGGPERMLLAAVLIRIASERDQQKWKPVLRPIVL
jgi:hypothetical protein